MVETLALYGGKPVRATPIAPDGERFGEEEIRLLVEVIRSQKLNCNVGSRVRQFAQAFADYMGMKHGVMVTSGTAAIHIALGACGLEPGDEVVTSPVTDMGTVYPILAQLGVPVFADLDPETLCMDVSDLERRITPRTRVIVPVHLAGTPCEMDAIMALARRRNLFVVEDCAQAFNAKFKGRKVGTFGDLSCFSLNQHKHITCGDGGIALTDDDALAERAILFADKAWPRTGEHRDHLFLAPNYRVTELQAAVALAQLTKLDHITDTRRDMGNLLTKLIADAPGICVPRLSPGDECTYWFYWFRVDASLRDEFARALTAEGLPASAGYMPKPIYLYDVLRLKKTYGNTSFPFGYAPFRDPGKEIEYCEGLCPVAERTLGQMIRFKLNEFWTEQDVRDAAECIWKVARYFATHAHDKRLA